ncbi:hypothetical protein E4U59_005321 [Claviceps monticola]|nr:hypothetical protein E4U59_005321 [Claviceps monticola]
MTIEETIPEMSPTMQSPYEAASDATSKPMNNSIDAEVATTNSTFERVWELMERRRRQRHVFPTRFTDEQWDELVTEFSETECQRPFVLELAYWRAVDSGARLPVCREY